MNNKAHLRPKDFDSNGDIIPMACKEEKGDLISRSELKKALHNFFDGKVIDEPAYILRDVFCLIDGAPELGYEDGILSVKDATRRAIELEEAYNNGWSDGFSEGRDERPQGEWEKIGEIGLAYKCNRCGEVAVIPTNFCPNCGAKMKGGAK